jgi:hypothetical protein
MLNLTVHKRATPPPRSLSLFAIVRNEDYLLPFFFEHYRRMGVEFFLIYDDRSDEPTREFLHAQSNCMIVGSDRKFGDVFGALPNGNPLRLPGYLKATLPDELLPDRWVLNVDADELLILPSGIDDLSQLTRLLDRIEQPYSTAPMVDLYGETLDHRNYPRTLSPFDGNPFFDGGPYYAWEGKVVPRELPAGVRRRLLAMLMKRYPERVHSIYGGRPISAVLWKVPLLKQGVGIKRVGDHRISVPPATAVTTALAHFKFIPDLDSKIEASLRERQYFRRSVEYSFLSAAASLLGSVSLICSKTKPFVGPHSLEAAGLLQPPTA